MKFEELIKGIEKLSDEDITRIVNELIRSDQGEALSSVGKVTKMLAGSQSIWMNLETSMFISTICCMIDAYCNANMVDDVRLAKKVYQTIAEMSGKE